MTGSCRDDDGLLSQASGTAQRPDLTKSDAEGMERREAWSGASAGQPVPRQEQAEVSVPSGEDSALSQPLGMRGPVRGGRLIIQQGADQT